LIIDIDKKLLFARPHVLSAARVSNDQAVAQAPQQLIAPAAPEPIKEIEELIGICFLRARLYWALRG
jgi:hypothetical protein